MTYFNWTKYSWTITKYLVVSCKNFNRDKQINWDKSGYDIDLKNSINFNQLKKKWNNFS